MSIFVAWYTERRMNVPHSSDKRVVRTRRVLRDALVALIIERGWDATSIQDVCDRADVGRSTFYTHFADKEDLLLSGFEDLRAMLKLAAKMTPRQGQGLAFVRPLLVHAHDNTRLFRALIGKRSSEAVQRQFLQVIVDMTRDELADGHKSGIALEAAVQYVSGALFQLVVWWVDGRKPLSPTQIGEIFERLTKPVLALGRHER
jgi:AcrR family transcriptional regulator